MPPRNMLRIINTYERRPWSIHFNSKRHLSQYIFYMSICRSKKYLLWFWDLICIKDRYKFICFEGIVIFIAHKIDEPKKSMEMLSYIKNYNHYYSKFIENLDPKYQTAYVIGNLLSKSIYGFEDMFNNKLIITDPKILKICVNYYRPSIDSHRRAMAKIIAFCIVTNINQSNELKNILKNMELDITFDELLNLM